jgi:23S rRNA pseudouridine1911/1915/1917 synthase
VSERADTLDLVIPSTLGGSRLDQALSSLLPQHSRSQLQRLIRDGAVAVDAAVTTRPSEAVRGGERVTLVLPVPVPAAPVPQSLPLDIVYQDRDLVVLNKPAGMVVHPAAGHRDGTLVNALLHAIPDLSGLGGELRPGIVHRLDRGTSGLMVVAKHDAAHRELTRQFSSREIDKEYLALVWGVVHAGRRVAAAIGRDPHDRKRMSVRAEGGRDALTHVTAATPYRGVTLVRVAIATGRTHQIRVHLQSIGHPVVGDATYGGVRRHLPADLRCLASLERPFLHAARLAFRHPRDGAPLRFEAPLPQDLADVLAHLPDA